MLREKEIPGASLNGWDLSELKVPELKWLACQGTPQKDKKTDLVASFVENFWSHTHNE